jgi:hypothetical protein
MSFFNPDGISFGLPTKTNNAAVSRAYYPEDSSDVEFHIEKQEISEDVHVAGKWAYIDVLLDEEENLNFIKTFDDHVVKVIYENSKEWFDKTLPHKVVDSFYQKSIRTRKDGQEFIRVKTGFTSGKANLPIKFVSPFNDQDDDHTDVVSETIEKYKGMPAKYVLTVKGIRFLKQSCYCDYVLRRICITDANSGRSVEDENGAEEEDEDSGASKADVVKPDAFNLDLRQLIINKPEKKSKFMRKREEHIHKLSELKKEVEERVASLLIEQEHTNKKYLDALKEQELFENKDDIEYFTDDELVEEDIEEAVRA